MSYEELKYGKNSDLENWVELLCFVQLSKQLGDCLNVRCYQSYYHLIKIILALMIVCIFNWSKQLLRPAHSRQKHLQWEQAYVQYLKITQTLRYKCVLSNDILSNQTNKVFPRNNVYIYYKTHYSKCIDYSWVSLSYLF